MKQWLAIFALICMAAATQTAADRHFIPSRAELHATVLAPQQDNAPATDNSPLLATPSTAARLLYGAEQTPGKFHRTPGTDLAAALHPHASACGPHTAPTVRTTTLGDCLTGTRSGDRYIYYLRRIII